MPRKHDYSQHFLRSPRLVAELIGHTNIRKNDVVYDLGAGSGVITSVLARRVREVVAVEIEPDALKQLRANMRGIDNVAIIEADILELQPMHDSYKIFANPPFSISSPLVRHFTQLDYSPKVLYLVTQRQFARKIVPSDQHFTSQLGIELAPWYAARIRKPLRKTDFTPPPAVDTVLLELKKREEPLLPASERDTYAKFVERCFTSQTYFAQITKAKAKRKAQRTARKANRK
jgi:23S rRNA (adenine-N6)-dimethyltransferase